MTLEEFESEFRIHNNSQQSVLCDGAGLNDGLSYEGAEIIECNYKTKDLDRISKRLIKRNENVSFLKDIILEKQQYHRIYFQVSLAQRDGLKEKLDFIEDNFDKLRDWWHVDQLPQFIKGDLNFSDAYERASDYVNSSMLFARRWGYVMFMPNLVKEKGVCEKLFSLLKNDNEYYVQMAEAWLICDIAVYYPEDVYNYLKICALDYNIVGKAIQKICDSYRIDSTYKWRVKELRKIIKKK